MLNLETFISIKKFGNVNSNIIIFIRIFSLTPKIIRSLNFFFKWQTSPKTCPNLTLNVSFMLVRMIITQWHMQYQTNIVWLISNSVHMLWYKNVMFITISMHVQPLFRCLFMMELKWQSSIRVLSQIWL